MWQSINSKSFAHYLNDIDRFDISSKGPLSGISIDVVTERINIILINLGGVMSVLGFASTAGQVSIQPVKLIDPFTELFTCNRVLIDAVQQCRYRYILQLRRYCGVYLYEMEVPKK